MAVGGILRPPGNGATLAERWNGASWSVYPTLNKVAAPGADENVSQLTGVSCSSPSSCIAVGTSTSYCDSCMSLGGGGETGEVRLAERWNGSRWSGMRVPSSDFGSLSAVSCRSSNACTAIGYDVLQWNGSTWKTQRSTGDLVAVSCAALRSCIAVGSSGESMLAERWNGFRWRIQDTTTAAHAPANSVLRGVSCISSTACTAVGAFMNETGVWMTLAERWNGSVWSIQRTQNPSGEGQLNSVSCTSPTACMAVGSSRSAVLIEGWNGIGWTIQQSPRPAGLVTSCGISVNNSGCIGLNAVSCTSQVACTSVGQFATTLKGNRSLQALVEVWDGARWSIQNTPSVGSWAWLSGVSCNLDTSCTAVGGSGLIERRNGSNWMIESLPPPNDLEGVACASVAACVAVGPDSGGGQPLVQGWDGSTWTAQPTPPTDFGHLWAVSCVSPDACTAVGGAGARSDVPLAESWDGARWSLDTVTRNQADILRGVSCTADNACVAVGESDANDERGFVQRPLAVHRK
jgi:hypothetical protein